MIDVIAVPKRLDDVVGKAEDHDVLHGLFAEIVVDAVDLGLGQDLPQFLVELFRGRQVVAEGFFDNHANPAAAFFFRQAALAQHFCDGREKPRRDRQVKESVSERVVLLVRFLDLLLQPGVSVCVLKITANVINTLPHPLPNLRVDRGGRIFGNFLRQHLSKALSGEVICGKTDDGELNRKKIVLGEIAERGKELALGQIAARTKDHHHTG